MKKRLGAVVGAGLVTFATLSACSDTEVTGSNPLTIELTATPETALVGDSIEFMYSATGALLTGTILDFGDGRVDSIPAFGAQSQGGRVKHAYAAAGMYVVIARVEDSIEGALTDQVTVGISDP